MWSNPIAALRLWWTEAAQTTRMFAVGIGLVLVISLMTWASLSARGYQVVFQNISSSEVPALEAVLRDHHIPMRYAPQDSTVSVPAGNADEASLAVDATGVLAKTANVSSTDTLDKIGLMTSPEVEQRRILQSEEDRLGEILRHLDHIQSASVTISPGSKGAMFGDDVPSTASVVVFLKPGEALTPAEIVGVRSYVQDAVPGIIPKHLTLIDQTGSPLQATGDEPLRPGTGPGVPASAQTQAIGVQPTAAQVPSPTVPKPGTAMAPALLGRIGLIVFVVLCLVAIWLLRLRSGQSNLPDTDLGRQIDPAPSVPQLARTVPEIEVHTPFQFLTVLPPAQIHDQLEREHPQTVAVILAQLPKADTTSLLAGLSENCRAEVAARMAALGELGPNIIRTVERALGQSLSQPRLGSIASPELTERAA